MRPDVSNSLWSFSSKTTMISLLTACLSFALAGCGDASLRTGISPVLDVASVQSAAANQATIVEALATDAGLATVDPEYYYRAAEAGLNYVDHQCNHNIDDMFYHYRSRSEIKSGLAAAGATTGAILGLTNASTMSLAIVASALGFASNATDIVAGTYVFAHPAESKILVNQLQKAFRDGVAANHGAINSRTSAYYAIQRYLNLCLPPTIEAEVARQVAATVAVGMPAGPGSLVSVETGSSLTVQRASFVGRSPSAISAKNIGTSRPRVAQLPSANTPLPATKQCPKPLPSSLLNCYEWRLSQSRDSIIRIQQTVCVSNPDGELGDVNSETRLNIQAFFEGLADPKQVYANDTGLTVSNVNTLGDAFEHATNNLGCKGAGFANAKMVGTFSTPKPSK